MKACPECQSDQLKKASLVNEEGTGVTVGVGVSTHGSIGVGGGVTTSALALRCAPPKEKTNTISYATGFSYILWLIPFLIANNQTESISAISTFWKIWFVAGLIVAARYSFRDSAASQQLHARAMEEYNRTYICTRCGTFSKPLE